MKLKDKVALITGGASGIGRATAELFSREGAKIMVADISSEGGEETAKKIKAAGGDAAFVKVDVTNSADVKHMVDETIKTYGRIDILFNNAGVPGESNKGLIEEDWHNVIETNLTGPFLGCLHAIPEMKKTGGGKIINTGSTGGLRATGRSAAYTASKGGVILLTRALAKMFVNDNIRVNCVCPGLTETPLSDSFLGGPKTEEEMVLIRETRLGPMKRLATPEEIAAAVLFLATDDCGFINGASLVVDGGTTA
jgi:NAD(P)-dependent dehydrogenase (short-subunit alcohol dehydrogenase family)